MARERRRKSQIITDDIAKIEEKIVGLDELKNMLTGETEVAATTEE